MKIERQIIKGHGFEVPSAAIIPVKAKGAAVVVHGYGGSKEEQLGLAWRVAESGIAAYAIDLRGHGEHTLPLSSEVILDVEAAIKHCRSLGKVAVLGHSLGGRLALTSSADVCIAISPALDNEFSMQTRTTLHNLRKYKVQYQAAGDFLEIFKQIPTWQPTKNRHTLVIYGTRDIPEIISACSKLNDKATVVKIEGALHNDIYLHEIAFGEVKKYLQQWM